MSNVIASSRIPIFALFVAVLISPTLAASPPQLETWAVGSKHVLKWDTSRFPVNSAVTVEISTDRGTTWAEAARGKNTGRIMWSVPEQAPSTAQLRVHAGKPVEALAVSETFSIGASREVKQYEWVEVENSAKFAARDGAGALTFKGRMWLLGGWNPGDKKSFPRICNNEVWSSADGKTWDLVKPNTFLDATFDAAKDWEGRHTAGYVVFNEKMWIVGGDVNQGHYHFDVWNSENGKTWTQVNAGKPVPWGPRALHHTLVFGGKIWVIGGQTVPQIAKSDEVFYRDLWNSSDGVTWTRVIPNEPFWPQRGMIGGSAVLNGRIWILGGGRYDTAKNPERKFFNDVWSSADGIDWTRHLEDAPWHPRQYHDVAAFDGRIWVLEGYHKDGGNRKDVWYSDDGLNWYEVENTPWAARHASSIFVHDGSLWVVAGNNMRSDVWKLQRRPSP